MFIKRRTRSKDGKTHVYYSVCESLRVSRSRVVQRQVLHLGELNTTQLDCWQKTIDVLHEDGQRYQRRLFSAREGAAPNEPDVIEVKLSSLELKAPRRFGDCWVGCQLWEELGLRAFWQHTLAEQAGDVPWDKVLELLVVNRLLAPRSELFVHEKWFGQTALDILLDSSGAVAEKDRLYRCRDRLLEHKEALEQHLAARWKDLFGASFDLLLYDLTSTDVEGQAKAVPKAQRGYSRDHRPDHWAITRTASASLAVVGVEIRRSAIVLGLGSGEIPESGAGRRSVFIAGALEGERPAEIVANLRAIERSRSGLPHAQKRGEDTSDLAWAGKANGSARVGGVFGLLLVGVFKKESRADRAEPDALADSRSTGAHHFSGGWVRT